MKKLLFLSSLDLTEGILSSSGVGKKILLQIETFKALGFEVDFIYKKNGIYYLKTNDNVSIKLIETEHKWYKDFDSICHHLRTWDDRPQYDMLYLRLERASYELFRLLKTLKRQKRDIWLTAEVPTVSKKWEKGASLPAIIKFVIKYTQKQLFSRGFNLIVTFDKCKKLFGTRTVCIENFADVTNLPVRQPHPRSEEFHILAIALMTEAHGFDRIISGMSKYYNEISCQKQVKLTVIGEGPAKKRLEQLATQFGLNDYVDFVGLKSTAEISEYVDWADIGAGSLAIFRKKCQKASELKIREYCARCLPFFYSAEEPILNDCPWCLKVPHDETPIDILSLIEFINGLNQEEVCQEMREFAEKKCTCRPQMERVLDVLNNK